MLNITTDYSFAKIISSAIISTNNFTNYIISNFSLADTSKAFKFILDISGNLTSQIHIYTTLPLSDTQLLQLTNLISNYIIEYQFKNISNINSISIYSFTQYIQQNFDLTDKINIPKFIYDTSGTIPIGIVLHMITPVPLSRISQLTNLVASYTDPLYSFPGLLRTFNIASPTNTDINTNHIFTRDITPFSSNNSVSISSFIIPYNKGPIPAVINQINLTFNIFAYDITLFSNDIIDTFSIELFNYTTNTSIIIITVIINDIISDWKNKTLSGSTGYITSTKVISIPNIYGTAPKYDCMIKINMIPSNKNIQLFLSKIQYLYYPFPIVSA